MILEMMRLKERGFQCGG